ncbi:thioredoxin [Kovacikia minuta]|uniref:thioredoxin n=1 Tax=Kovacikia minuta TaxID=2931930 RepID=UPI0036F2CC69
MAVKKQFSSFQELVSGSDTPVLVDFYATWCGPCQMMAGILEQVNAQMKHQLKVIKIDTEKYPNLASEYQIYALPTLVLFKQGQPVERIEGVLPADQLIQRLKGLVWGEGGRAKGEGEGRRGGGMKVIFVSPFPFPFPP